MGDNDFDQVGKILFNGVPSIDKCGFPGTLIPLTNDTRAVLAGTDSNDIVIAAARYGQGRVLIFAHNAYSQMFINNEDRNKPFIENCRQWLTHGQSDGFVSINDASSMENVSKDRKILVWDGHSTKSEEFLNKLFEYLQNGGALVCATTAWGWLQSSNGSTLNDFSFYRFCQRLGVKLTGNMSKASNPIVYREELVQFGNIEQTANQLVQDPNNVQHVSLIGGVMKDIDNSLPNVSADTLRNIVANTKSEAIPCKSCPVRDKQCRDKTTGISGIMCGIPGIKAPGIHEFPGDFDKKPNLLNDIQVHIQNSPDVWHSTGYYVCAGVPVQIQVTEIIGEKGWSARIGCHSDDLSNCNELRRWPCISITKSLSAGQSIEMHSPYGGLLFFQPPSNRSGSIRAVLNNVVLTPTYDLNDPNRVQHWQNVQSNGTGLWADIAGRHIVFNFPSKSVLNFTHQQLDRVLNFWDSIILANHDLRGTKPEHRERIVVDEQPAAGYMHSGYPIVTHLDVGDPKSNDFLLNSAKLEDIGSWGLFHELGHNMQRGWWTFNGTVEVTVNLFTLHAMENICKKPAWIHPWLKERLLSTISYIQKGASFNDWKTNPGIALFIYAQLVREFGWDTYKQVFRKYEESAPTLNSDQDKIDFWISTFSKQVKKNLVPLFKFWGFPISTSTAAELKQFEIPKISDDFIRLAPNRYAV